MNDVRRALPSVRALLECAELQPLLLTVPRALLLSAVRATVNDVRTGAAAECHTWAEWSTTVAATVSRMNRPSLRPVINATGVVLHTNLGRAPLASVALDAVQAVAGGYSTLEYDLASGARGSRYAHCASLLRELTGAEDALVVNNCAGALVLALNTVAAGREAILSRGELVEIGGSFRVHEIMEKSGVTLREIGATNRTHLGDYVRAVSERTGALLKVHRSNFAVSGFVAEVAVRELVPVAREHDLPILHDLGSGLLVPLDDLGLRGEPTARQALEAGASIVMMSGDKLLGGPQAGLLVGSAALIGAMRSNPLARSYRVDKMTLAALEATLALYREPERARRDIPVLAMLAVQVDALRARGGRLAGQLADAGIAVSVVESVATVGAGAFPLAQLPSAALALQGSAERWARALREAATPVIGRVADGALLLDLRTVLPATESALVTSIIAAHA